jgi:hypothetical protein
MKRMATASHHQVEDRGNRSNVGDQRTHAHLSILSIGYRIHFSQVHHGLERMEPSVAFAVRQGCLR